MLLKHEHATSNNPNLEDYELDEYYGMNYDMLPKKLARRSILFGRKYKDSNKRLLAIFRNAVRNEGIFIP